MNAADYINALKSSVEGSAERDHAIRTTAGLISQAASDQLVDVAIGAALLYIVTLCDVHRLAAPTIDAYTADKLRKVADLLDPKTE